MSQELVAFTPTDADALIAMIEAAGGQTISTPTTRGRMTVKWGMTTSAGIAANSIGECYIRKPSGTSWANDYLETEVYNEGEAIPGNTKVLLIPIDGRWCVFDVCAGTTE